MASVKQSWIRKYGEEIGIKMWEERKKLSASTLDSFIIKYGDVDGPIKYQMWKTNLAKSKTLDGYIEKYGEKIGKEKYKEKNKKLSVSESALKLSGKNDDEIRDIRKRHSEKSRITIDTMILKYGYELGVRKWNDRIFNAKISSKRSIEYWIKKCDNDLILAKEKLSEYQRRDRDFYIKKYGEVVGIERYEDAKKKRFLGGFKEPCSIFQKEVEDYIRSEFPNTEIRGHKNCFCFFDTKTLNQSVVIPDIFIEEYKVIIECFGDYWHCSSKYSDNFFHEVIKKTAKEIRQSDQERINFYKLNGYDTIVIWEGDWNNNKTEQKEKLIYEINKKRSE